MDEDDEQVIEITPTMHELKMSVWAIADVEERVTERVAVLYKF